MHLFHGGIRLIPLFLHEVLCLSQHVTLDSNKPKWLVSYNPGWGPVGLEKLGSFCIDT